MASGRFSRWSGAAALCGAVVLMAAVPPDRAVIVDSGSTNTVGYRIEVSSDGSASVATQHTATTSSAPKPLHLTKAIVSKLFADLAAVRKSGVATAPCMKSASFGSTIHVTWQGWVSPDLSCPPNDSAGAALAADVENIRDASGTNGAQLRRAPAQTQPPE